MTTIKQIETRLDKMQKQIYVINEQLGIMPNLVKPLDWKGLTDRDKQVLTFLISQPRPKCFTTTQIATEIKLPKPSDSGRVLVYTSLKRIEKLSRRKRKYILIHDRSARTWMMNRDEFRFLVTLDQNL